MASFPVNTVLVLHLTIVFVLFSSSSATRIGKKAPSTDMQDICSSAPDPPSCLQILNSIPRTPKNDLNGIANLAIILAEKTTKEAITFTNFLIQSSKDAMMKARYDSCNRYFNSVVVALVKAKKSLHSGDSLAWHEAAIDAVESAESCEDEFEDMPSESFLFVKKIKEVINHTGVVFALAQKGSS